jgi:hypothetical protein
MAQDFMELDTKVWNLGKQSVATLWHKYGEAKRKSRLGSESKTEYYRCFHKPCQARLKLATDCATGTSVSRRATGQHCHEIQIAKIVETIPKQTSWEPGGSSLGA